MLRERRLIKHRRESIRGTNPSEKNWSSFPSHDSKISGCLRPKAARPSAKAGVPCVAYLDLRSPPTGREGAGPPVPVPVLPRDRPRPPGEGELLPGVLVAVEPGPVVGPALQGEAQRAAPAFDPAEAVVSRDLRVLRRRKNRDGKKDGRRKNKKL